MNAKLQELFDSNKTENKRATIHNEVMRAVEANPGEWLGDLEEAFQVASNMLTEKRAAWNDAEQEVNVRESLLTDAKRGDPDDHEGDLIRAKATAYDAFWENGFAHIVFDVMYELRADCYICQEYHKERATVEVI